MTSQVFCKRHSAAISHFNRSRGATVLFMLAASLALPTLLGAGCDTTLFDPRPLCLDGDWQLGEQIFVTISNGHVTSSILEQSFGQFTEEFPGLSFNPALSAEQLSLEEGAFSMQITETLGGIGLVRVNFVFTFEGRMQDNDTIVGSFSVSGSLAGIDFGDLLGLGGTVSEPAEGLMTRLSNTAGLDCVTAAP